jgi:DNA gyrase subunit B
MSERSTWENTTHDWAMSVDRAHLQLIRDHADDYAGSGVPHLVLEVLAYANDEAESIGRQGHCTVTHHGDLGRR